MHFLRELAHRIVDPASRRFAHVHDVLVKRVPLVAVGSTARLRERNPRDMERNVLNQPLALHSTSPMTGFLRTGYCTAPPSDGGNHSVAGIVTTEFLDFSAARGNDLRTIGLTDGCKWCLCVSRWKEAFDARTGAGDKKVPKVVLGATSKRALEKVKLDDLRAFAADEGNGSGNSREL